MLEWADLIEVDFSHADLRGAFLFNTNLETAASLEHALYDSSTVFPEGFDPEFHGMENVEVCPADFNGDTQVDILDLLSVIDYWGTAGADANFDGNTDVLDLLAVIDGWGTCM